MKSIRLFAVLAIFIIVFIFGCGKKATISDELMGTWKTTESKYKGTFFELTQDKVIFGTQAGEVNANTIKKVKKEKVPDTEETLYRITHLDLEGRESIFSFYYNPKNSGEIRFQNQPELIWTKEKD